MAFMLYQSLTRSVDLPLQCAYACRFLSPVVWWSVVHGLSALSAWYLLSYVLRKTLKILLTYQGWMIERHK